MKGRASVFDGACLLGDHEKCPGTCDCKCHAKVLTLDAHIDTLWMLSGHSIRVTPPVVDLERMQFGGLDKAIFALYLSDETQDRLGNDAAWGEIKAQIGMARKRFPGHYIALEGGRVLGLKDVEVFCRLQELADAGIKYLTLTHNANNQICCSSTDHSDTGLTRLGLDVVDDCERLDILVDVSHASDLTIEHIMSTQTRPVIASHSGCRAVVRHPRNLTNAQILGIAKSGGVVGIPFARKFVWTLKGVADHIDQICHITGDCEHVGIGSDLDGAGLVDGCQGAQDWSKVVVDGLVARGYATENILAIVGGNWMRVLGQVTG